MKRIRISLVALALLLTTAACDAASVTSANECTDPTVGSGAGRCA